MVHNITKHNNLRYGGLTDNVRPQIFDLDVELS